MLLDKAMPRWDQRSSHRIVTDSPSSDLFTALERLTWSDVRVFKALMTLRGFGRRSLGPRSLVLDWFTSNGFRQLARSDDELVFAAVHDLAHGSRERTPATVVAFRDFAEPRCIKIAFNFRTDDGFLTTQTRVRSTDERARRVFTIYWLAIRAGSGVIRHLWLRAIRRRAATGRAQPSGSME